MKDENDEARAATETSLGDGVSIEASLSRSRSIVASAVGLCGLVVGLLPSAFVLFTCLAHLLPHWGLNVSGGFWGAGIMMACVWMIPTAAVVAVVLAVVSGLVGNAETAGPAFRGAMLSPLAFVCLIACTMLASFMGFHGY